MQISGYSSAAMLAYRSSGMKQKAGTVKMQDFSQMVQNTSAQATSQTDNSRSSGLTFCISNGQLYVVPVCKM